MTDDIQDPVAGRDYMSDSSPTPKRCQVRVHDGGRLVSSHVCGRKLSGSEDYPELCGLHAAAKRRAVANQQRDAADRNKSHDEVTKADDLADRLTIELGVKVSAETKFDTKIRRWPTGFGLVKLADLESLATRIDELETALEGYVRVERNLLEGK